MSARAVPLRTGGSGLGGVDVLGEGLAGHLHKGLEAREIVQKLYQRQLGSVQAVGEINSDDVRGLNKSLVRLERFWSDQIRYRL